MLINPIDLLPSPIRKWVVLVALFIFLPICSIGFVRLVIAHQWTDAGVTGGLIALAVWSNLKARRFE